jgi:hypothetical protein
MGFALVCGTCIVSRLRRRRPCCCLLRKETWYHVKPLVRFFMRCIWIKPAAHRVGYVGEFLWVSLSTKRLHGCGNMILKRCLTFGLGLFGLNVWFGWDCWDLIQTIPTLDASERWWVTAKLTSPSVFFQSLWLCLHTKFPLPHYILKPNQFRLGLWLAARYNWSAIGLWTARHK